MLLPYTQQYTHDTERNLRACAKAGPGVSHKGTLSKVAKGPGQKPSPRPGGTSCYRAAGTPLSLARGSEGYLHLAHAEPCLSNDSPRPTETPESDRAIRTCRSHTCRAIPRPPAWDMSSPVTVGLCTMDRHNSISGTLTPLLPQDGGVACGTPAARAAPAWMAILLLFLLLLILLFLLIAPEAWGPEAGVALLHQLCWRTRAGQPRAVGDGTRRRGTLRTIPRDTRQATEPDRTARLQPLRCPPPSLPDPCHHRLRQPSPLHPLAPGGSQPRSPAIV